MSAKYWIAKHVDDPFRNEPKNIGVIVELNGTVSAKFIGERDDGNFDLRRLRGFRYPSVFSQWRDYWRKSLLAASDPAAVLKANSVNFYLEAGGEVVDTGGDAAADVCHFIFNLVVGDGALAAFEWEVEEADEVALADDIRRAFAQAEILASAAALFVRHPILADAPVDGRQVAHRPSFSQRNGVLSVIEHIDLSSSKLNKTKERAGWMAYMFEDIRQREGTATTFSLIRPERGSAGEQIQYAKSMLGNESTVINWSDEGERAHFIDERLAIASQTPIGG